MEDGSNPYLLIVLCIIALIELAVIIILYRRSKQENVTEEDVISLVNEGHEDGNILASEAAMIQNIFEFSDTDAKDIMTHRKNIVAINGDYTLREKTCMSFYRLQNLFLKLTELILYLPKCSPKSAIWLLLWMNMARFQDYYH